MSERQMGVSRKFWIERYMRRRTNLSFKENTQSSFGIQLLACLLVNCFFFQMPSYFDTKLLRKLVVSRRLTIKSGFLIT